MRWSLIVLALFSLTACDDGPKRKRPINEREKEEYYFEDARKVDNISIGPKMYRVENKEVICYVTKAGGMSCKWKAAIE